MTDQTNPSESSSPSSESLPETTTRTTKNKDRKPTPRELFVERMKREGRGPEWFETLRKVQIGTGKQFGTAATETMKLMGYVSPEEERRLHQAYLDTLHKTAAQKELAVKKAEIREEKRTQNYEEALALLPNVAHPQVELDWIATHPAIVRNSRSMDQTKQVILTADDVLCSPNGRAPSVRAANMLQFWANQPQKFNEMLMGEFKKQVESGGDKGPKVGKDTGLDEVERLLTEVTSGIQTEETA